MDLLAWILFAGIFVEKADIVDKKSRNGLFSIDISMKRSIINKNSNMRYYTLLFGLMRRGIVLENKYIRNLRVRKSLVVKKLYMAVCMVLVASLLVSAASYAWLVLSQAPEVSGMASNIGANGNLEIALGKNIRESAIGDSSNKSKVTQANRTWGNLIDLSDPSYGLQEIILRPVILNAAGGAVNTLHPFMHPVYGTDGRVEKLYTNDVFAGIYNGERFVTSANEYGVRAIGTADYTAPGLEDTFGPLSERQKLYYDACDALERRSACYERDYYGFYDQATMGRSYLALCRTSRDALMAYCTNGTGASASDLDLNVFAESVDAVIYEANEELRLSFTLFAAAEMTTSEAYFTVMDTLEKEYPDYEFAQPFVYSAIQAHKNMAYSAVVDVQAAITELRAFQDAAAQLKAVIASGEIDSSDSYSMEEIEKTVGLIFDLEKTKVTGSDSSYSDSYYSNVNPELVLSRYANKHGAYTYFNNSSVRNLVYGLDGTAGYQDNDSRGGTASDINYTHLYSVSQSLQFTDLDRAIADLYASHWNYWDACAEDYERLTEEAAELETQIEALQNVIAEQQEQTDGGQNDLDALEAELLLKTAELEEKEEQLRTLADEEIYTYDDSRLESIRTAMTDTVELMRKYTLWSIAYFACDGQVPDDAYHRMLEIANSSEYIHPGTAYQALCNYGVTPAYELSQMVEAYGKLEQELLFLQKTPGKADSVTWSEINAELQRVFGTITHSFNFSISIRKNNTSYSSTAYSSSYSPEDSAVPTEVMTRIREEIEAHEAAEAKVEADTTVASRWSYFNHYISYGVEGENQLWTQALNLLTSFYDTWDTISGGYFGHTLEGVQFDVYSRMMYTEGFRFAISIGVGSEDNFNESGLTVRQTRFQKAQQNISYYQNQLISAAVSADKEMVTSLMQMIAGQSDVSIRTISDYLLSLHEQLEYAEEMLYQAALAMAASDYAEDSAYRYVYSDSAPKDAAGLIELLRQSDFDKDVLNALDHRMALLNNQSALLSQSAALLKNYQDPKTGAWTTEQIPIAEAAALLNPVLDTASLTLYGYVEEEQRRNEESDATEETLPPSYLRTVLYMGFGSPSVQIDGQKATVKDKEPVTIFGDVYLSLGRSLSGSLLAFAKTQVETYTPPAGSLSADDIADAENGTNRHAYAIGTGDNMFTLNLRTADASYALATNLWDYTGNTNYISANNVLSDLYGYCIDLSFRTNVVGSDLLLQTDAIDRIYNHGEAQTDTAMGAGSYMEFAIMDASYTVHAAEEYMACLRVVITDTNTGYIYGYAALDMDAVSIMDEKIKAPLRLYDKDTGTMLEGDAAQYICHLEQNLEKNLTVYVYLDGAKTSDSIVAAYTEQSLYGVLNLQFSSSANLIPAGIDVSEKPSEPPTEEPEIPGEPDTPESGGTTVVNAGEMTDTITWTLYSNGLLKFEGTGAMPDFSADRDAPWYDNRNSVTTV